jgi:hypothetical protein
MDDFTRQGVLIAEAFSRPLSAAFDAPAVTSDGGAVLLRCADRRLGLVERLAGCLRDGRKQDRIEHSTLELLRQRVYALALGYSDGNDMHRLREDPALSLATRGDFDPSRALASQPTISRLENAPTPGELLAMADVLAASAVDRVARFHPHPRRIVIDLDPSVDPAHGEQQGVLFNAFYGTHCYLPVLGFLSVPGTAGHHLWLARLRPGGAKAWRATRRALRRLLALLRRRFPGTRLLVRLDAGFMHGRLLDFLEDQGVEYVVGMPTNPRLERFAAKALGRVTARARRTGEEARELRECRYRARHWGRGRRIVLRAEAVPHPGRGVKATPRYVVTNLRVSRERVYATYCERGDSENRIKELKSGLAIDRTSCPRFCANQLRVLLTAAAYALLEELRHQARGTDLERAQVATLRCALLRIGARVEKSVRRFVLHLAAAHPWQSLWRRVALRLGAQSG